MRWATPAAFIYTYSEPPWRKARSTPPVLTEITRRCWQHLQKGAKTRIVHNKRKCFRKTLLLPAQFSERLRVKFRPLWRTHSAAHCEHWYSEEIRNWMRKTQHCDSSNLHWAQCKLSMCTMWNFIIPWGWRAVKILGSALGSFGVDNPVATHSLC